MRECVGYKKVAMYMTFCLFVFSLISPAYIFFGGNRLSRIAYGRMPGIQLQFTLYDRISIISFFTLLSVFFIVNTFAEKKIYLKILSLFSFLYSTFYLIVTTLIGENGLVIFNFPIISIPLYVVILSKLLLLIPTAYFFMISADKRNSRFVRYSAFFHSAALLLICIIKVFEVIFPVALRDIFFDISIAVYLVSLSMVTFFMYRKYYEC